MQNVRKITMGLMALILTLMMATPVLANDDINYLNDQITALQNQINTLVAENATLLNQVNQAGNQWALIAELQDEIAELRAQANQPPAQVFLPRLQLLSPLSVNLAPGESMDIPLIIRNTGIGRAENIVTQAVPSAAAPFTVQFLNNSNTVNNIGENRQHTMTLRITANANASVGSHSVSLNHHFRTENQELRASSDTLSVSIVGEGDVTPTLSIRNMSAPTTLFNPLQTATISFEIHNSSNIEARNVSVVAAPENPAHIVPVQTAGTQSIPVIPPGESRSVTFHFSPRESATTRSYAIGFSVRHVNETLFTQFESINVYNPEDSEESVANIEIRNMSAPTGNLRVGQTATITFYVHNTGNTEARGIDVAATAPSGIVPVQVADMQTIQSLAAGESRRMTFSFMATDAAATRSHAISFAVTHSGRTSRVTAALNVYNPDADDTPTGPVQTPRVMVANTTIYPAVPRAGQPFEMEITFRNTSATRSVNNILILMQEVSTHVPGQGAQHWAGFNPLDGSNTLFIDHLDPLGEYTMTLRFTTVVEATPGAHNINFSFTYQDQDFRDFTASQQLSISVAQFSQLELQDVQVGDWWGGMPSVGAPLPFSFRVLNSGRVNIMSIRVHTEGPFDVSDAGGTDGIFIGQVNFQRSTGFDGVIVPMYPGEQSGYFVVSGEDMTGQRVEIRHPFTIFVDAGGGMGGDWGEGGGRPGMGMEIGRPGMGIDMGPFIQEYEWCSVREEMVSAGYWHPETGEWVPTGERCYDTWEWIEFNSGFDFLGFIRRPIVWGPAIGVAAIGLIAIIVVVARKKKSSFDFDDDM